MSELQRRGFLKVVSALAAATGLVRYIETPILMPNKHEWIEDMGDYYIVRVPEGKTFANERLDKPTLFGLEDRATVTGIEVLGYANVYHKGQFAFMHSRFDTSKMILDHKRPAMNIIGVGPANKAGSMLNGIHVDTGLRHPELSLNL
jgi:hypothetical protein